MSGKKLVIVGSGLGSLVCGAILSREGFEVTILEMNKQIGGNLQTFIRDKHVFDSGVHYVGGLSEGQNLYTIFKYLGIYDELPLEKLDEIGFDRICLANDPNTYLMSQGYAAFSRHLTEAFPLEKEAIDEYCRLVQQVCQDFPLYNLRTGTNDGKISWMDQGCRDVINRLTTNETLRKVLAGNNLLYAGEPELVPFYMQALVMNSYIESAWKVVGGGSKIASLLSRQIRKQNGRILTKRRVVKLHVEDDRIQAAETEDGNRVYGDHFISGIHPAITFDMIDSPLIRSGFRNRLDNLENTLSAFTLNISLHPGILPYETCNYYCHLSDQVWADPDYDPKDWPSQYALFYSPDGKDREFARGITLMTYMNFNEVKSWSDTYNTVAHPSDRTAAYQQFKEEKSQALIRAASARFPLLEKAIKSYYASTPLTYRDYMGTRDGSIYGIAKDYQNPLKTMIPVRTKISNLYLTGQNLNLHGILGVTMSALLTSSQFIGLESLLDKIKQTDNA